jgi:hypothetical protein
MSRWKAALIHSGISLIVGLSVFALLAGVWYPPPYFHAAGGDKLVLLLLGVDLVLGPVLTFVVFKSGKKGLKFDLSMIGLAQIAALLYGLHVVVASRPAFLVASVDRFVLVSANELEDADLALGSQSEFRSRSWTGPRLVATRRPDSAAERSAILDSALVGKDIEKLPKHYVSYASQSAALLARAHALDVLRPGDAAAAAQVKEWL